MSSACDGVHETEELRAGERVALSVAEELFRYGANSVQTVCTDSQDSVQTARIKI